MLQNMLRSIVRWNLSHNQNLTAKIAQLSVEVNEINKKYDSLLAEVQRIKEDKTPPAEIRPVNVLFTVPLEDRNGIPLAGNIGSTIADFSIECAGSNGLNVTRFVPDMKRPQSNYIHLEVIGTGTLEITIRQTLTMSDGTSFISVKRLCNVEINNTEQQYYVNSITSMAISDMFTLYTPNRMAIDN